MIFIVKIRIREFKEGNKLLKITNNLLNNLIRKVENFKIMQISRTWKCCTQSSNADVALIIAADDIN